MTDPTLDAAERIQQLGQVQDALVREIARLKQTTLEQEAQLWVRRSPQPLRERRLWWPVEVRLRWERGPRDWRWGTRHGSQRPYGVIQYLRFGPIGVTLGYQQELEDWHATQTRHFHTMWRSARPRAHEHALQELARFEHHAQVIDLP